ncbi:MAG: Uncharacterised protein [Methanobacteriota archaeon]|jgi:hypothetical protein|nr:hypothetical protein [Euryarchaeota archaeon]CAI8173497.1 MAG: Uncharacterised protein [Euryarchaeota archaeon]|tara:strand:+ start:2539 stop:2970 length:432 start_codon:yes stop_codon:yes gene_type:complete
MRESNRDDRAQMLLATGVVLMMSLLSMAIYGVKMAGLNSPYDTTGDASILASRDVIDSLPSLTEERAQIWYGGGMSEIESIEKALESLHDDILHHGEIRGVELKLLNMTATEDSGVITVTGELGAADRNTMLTREISYSLDLD